MDTKKEAPILFLGWTTSFGPYGETRPIVVQYERYTWEEMARKWPPTKKEIDDG